MRLKIFGKMVEVYKVSKTIRAIKSIGLIDSYKKAYKITYNGLTNETLKRTEDMDRLRLLELHLLRYELESSIASLNDSDKFLVILRIRECASDIFPEFKVGDDVTSHDIMFALVTLSYVAMYDGEELIDMLYGLHRNLLFSHHYYSKILDDVLANRIYEDTNMPITE